MSRIVELTSSNFDRALRSSKKTFVDFWAPWCRPCLNMEPVIEKLAGKHESILFAKINVDENGDIAMRYRVSSVPTYVIFDGASPRESRVGAMSEGELEKLVSSHAPTSGSRSLNG